MDGEFYCKYCKINNSIRTKACHQCGRRLGVIYSNTVDIDLQVDSIDSDSRAVEDSSSEQDEAAQLQQIAHTLVGAIRKSPLTQQPSSQITVNLIRTFCKVYWGVHDFRC